MKRLVYIVAYARVGYVSNNSKLSDIITAVEQAENPSSRSVGLGAPVSDKSSSDRKTVPALESFTGQDEDYFSWKEKTINTLGRVGFGRFLTDSSLAVSSKDSAESVFYALRAAMYGGVASTLSQELLDAGEFDPYKLWASLSRYYDTSLNRANVVLFEIKRLLKLQLDVATTPVQFISDFRDCLQRLRKNKAKVADDDQTLRALLLVAIQDESFESIRDNILEKPNRSVDELLGDIREKDTSLQMKDGVRSLQGDGQISSRRTQVQGKGNSRGKTADAIEQGLWVIPPFPRGWKEAVGAKLFQVMSDWRSSAIYKNFLIKKLNEDFAMKVENSSIKNYQSKNKFKKSRRARNKDDDESVEKDDDNTISTDDGNKIRISLNKSRRVITEK